MTVNFCSTYAVHQSNVQNLKLVKSIQDTETEYLWASKRLRRPNQNGSTPNFWLYGCLDKVRCVYIDEIAAQPNKKGGAMGVPLLVALLSQTWSCRGCCCLCLGGRYIKPYYVSPNRLYFWSIKQLEDPLHQRGMK